jgi:hypothetical protein
MHDLVKGEEFLSWVRYLFDHPVTDPEWYWDYLNPLPAAIRWPNSSDSELKFVTALFNNSEELFRPFSNAQLDQGLRHFIDPGGWDLLRATLNERSSALLRHQCVESISVLFERVFLPRCSPHLSHINEEGADTINSVCYMWWDICPRTLEGQDAQFIPVMEKSLALDSPARKESALHGLGHWYCEFPTRSKR